MALQWSKAMEALHSAGVADLVQRDPRTDWDDDRRVSLGYPFETIRTDVVKHGLADFNEGYRSEFGELSADDKVLLYCYVYLKLHFFETLATFRHYKQSIDVMFNSQRAGLMIDMGCGPGTAGLALADCLSVPKLSYYGLDRAKPMLRKAKSLLTAAVDTGLLHKETKIGATSSWSILHHNITSMKTPCNVHVNATYLFASASLVVEDVCSVVNHLIDNPNVKEVVFTFLNSAAAQKSAKFRQFAKISHGKFSADEPQNVTIEYHKKRNGQSIAQATFVRQLLKFKEV